MKIEIIIDKLVLHGFSNSNRYLIGETIEREITRLVKDKGAFSSLTKGSETPYIGGGQFDIKAGANSRNIGKHVAKIVFGNINRISAKGQGQPARVPEAPFQASVQKNQKDTI